MTHRRGVTCQLTAFHIANPPDNGVYGPHEWMAIATAQVYNPNPERGGILTSETAILAGAVMEVIHGRATAATQEDALVTALKGLLFQMEAKGHSVDVLHGAT
jgi:hypothetical protein